MPLAKTAASVGLVEAAISRHCGGKQRQLTENPDDLSQELLAELGAPLMHAGNHLAHRNAHADQ